jgi:hypothetical protein
MYHLPQSIKIQVKLTKIRMYQAAKVEIMASLLYWEFFGFGGERAARGY